MNHLLLYSTIEAPHCCNGCYARLYKAHCLLLGCAILSQYSLERESFYLKLIIIILRICFRLKSVTQCVVPQKINLDYLVDHKIT